VIGGVAAAAVVIALGTDVLPAALFGTILAAVWIVEGLRRARK
jgi:hypothetical protein